MLDVEVFGGEHARGGADVKRPKQRRRTADRAHLDLVNCPCGRAGCNRRISQLDQEGSDRNDAPEHGVFSIRDG